MGPSKRKRRPAKAKAKAMMVAARAVDARVKKTTNPKSVPRHKRHANLRRSSSRPRAVNCPMLRLKLWLERRQTRRHRRPRRRSRLGVQKIGEMNPGMQEAG